MNKYFSLGKKYGYPECCINEFIMHSNLKTYSKLPNRKLHGTGYRPCLSCNSKYSENILIDNVNKNRDKSLEFFHSKI